MSGTSSSQLTGPPLIRTGVVVVTQVQPISVIFTLPMDDIPGVQDALGKGRLKTIAFSQDGKMPLDTGQLLLVDNQADPTSGTVRLAVLRKGNDGRPAHGYSRRKSDE
jgi:hypothetical protein